MRVVFFLALIQVCARDVCILKYPPTWQNVAAPFAREGREAKML